MAKMRLIEQFIVASDKDALGIIQVTITFKLKIKLKLSINIV